MTVTDWEKLRVDAQDTLASLDSKKMNKDAFLLAGASVAILDHLDDMGQTALPNPQEYHTSEPMAQCGVLDDFSVILSRYSNSRSMADRDAMRATLKAQLAAIEKELVEMRHEVHDPEAVKMFIEFRENLRLKL